MSALGKLLEQQQKKSAVWLKIYLAVLVILVAANFFFTPAEPHFGLDAYPLFWPCFGLFVGLGMILLVKKIIQPLIVRKEGFYNDI